MISSIVKSASSDKRQFFAQHRGNGPEETGPSHGVRGSEANEAFLRLLGYDRDDLVSGRIHWTDCTPNEWRVDDLPFDHRGSRRSNSGRARTCLGARHFNSRYQRRVVVTEGGAPRFAGPSNCRPRAGTLRRLKFLTEGREKAYVSFILHLTRLREICLQLGVISEVGHLFPWRAGRLMPKLKPRSPDHDCA